MQGSVTCADRLHRAVRGAATQSACAAWGDLCLQVRTQLDGSLLIAREQARPFSFCSGYLCLLEANRLSSWTWTPKFGHSMQTCQTLPW